MAHEVEQKDSRSITIDENGLVITAIYLVFDTDNPFEALTHVPAFGDKYIDEFGERNVFVNRIRPVMDPPNRVRVTLTFGPIKASENTPPEPVANTASWRLDGLAQTEHREVVLGNTTQKHFPEAAAYQGQSINVTDDGVEGVDVPIPHANLVIDQWLAPSVATPEFIDAITAVGGSVNEAPFTGPWGNWKKYEALYHGPVIGHINDELLQVTHTFERSFDATGDDSLFIPIDSTGVNEVVAKKGWQFLWRRIGDTKDPFDPEKTLKAAVIDVHVADVVPEKDFSLLLLPAEFVGG